MLDQHLHWLTGMASVSRHQVGDKAFYLGSAHQRGYPIIPGCVISTEVFREFINTIYWGNPWLAGFTTLDLHLDPGHPKQLQAVAQQIRRTIIAAQFPHAWLSSLVEAIQTLDVPYLMCRPSISVEFSDDPAVSTKLKGLLAPQYCQAEPDAIAQAVKMAWAEAFRAKSLVVWQRSAISLQDLRIGVLVQPVYSALASGTLHPNPTGDRLDVTACWGLGGSVKTGEVVPDWYRIHPGSGIVETQHLNHKMYAYGISGETHSDLWAPVSSIDQLEIQSFPQALSRYEVQPTHQKGSVLSQPTLSALAQLYQQLFDEWGFNSQLEWVLGTVPASSDAPIRKTTVLGNQQAYLYVTQISPQPKPVAQQKFQPKHALSSRGGRERDAAPNKPMELRSAQPSSTAMPVVSALGAAPGQVIAPVWVIHERAAQSIAQVPTGYVLVAPDVMPDWMLDIQRTVGLVSEQGGMTCHAAIVARELGIPAVVGAHQITRLLNTGDKVLVNGDRGTIHRIDAEADPVKDAIAPSSLRPSSLGQSFPGRASLGSPPYSLPENERSNTPQTRAEHTDDSDQAGGSSQLQHRTQVMVSLSQVERLSELRDYPIDGIGLLRGELLLPTVLNRQSLAQRLQSGQTHELITQFCDRLQPFLEAMYPRPVYYRTADLRTNEFATLLGNPAPSEYGQSSSFPVLDDAQNPLLGSHGTLSYVNHPALFELELTVLYQLRRKGYDNIHVILPFVRTVEEFVACRQLIRQANLLAFADFQIWIMAEVPSVLFLLPEYVDAGISGIAIGTNDLAQLILALDRNHPTLSTVLDPRHPAVMRAIERLVKTARQLSIPCSICGEAPGQYPELIRSFVEWGATSVSVSPSAVIQTHEAIAQAEQALHLIEHSTESDS